MNDRFPARVLGAIVGAKSPPDRKLIAFTQALGAVLGEALEADDLDLESVSRPAPLDAKPELTDITPGTPINLG